MGEWRGVSLRQIAARELAPYRGPDDKLMTVNGDDCLAAAAAMLPVAMLSHELATNAAKHGAFARCGQLHLRWEVDEMLLRILRTETGGATASEPP
jgi:two-component sensor histidine kinase